MPGMERSHRTLRTVEGIFEVSSVFFPPQFVIIIGHFMAFTLWAVWVDTDLSCQALTAPVVKLIELHETVTVELTMFVQQKCWDLRTQTVLNCLISMLTSTEGLSSELLHIYTAWHSATASWCLLLQTVTVHIFKLGAKSLAVLPWGQSMASQQNAVNYHKIILTAMIIIPWRLLMPKAPESIRSAFKTEWRTVGIDWA